MVSVCSDGTCAIHADVPAPVPLPWEEYGIDSNPKPCEERLLVWAKEASDWQEIHNLESSGVFNQGLSVLW